MFTACDRPISSTPNMGHRNYAAGVLGRFISRDPIGHRGGLNLYAYPTNPISFVDPSGLNVYLWIRAQRESETFWDEGHVWIEVDDGKGGRYSIGSWPSSGLRSPDGTCSIEQTIKHTEEGDSFSTDQDTFYLERVYKTTPQEDQTFIKFLEVMRSISKRNPRAFYSFRSKRNNGKPFVCTNNATWLLNAQDFTKGRKLPGIDVYYPNDLHNRLNPNGHQLKVVPHVLDTSWGK